MNTKIYKLSRWNSYIPLRNRSGLVYNAFTDRFIAVKETSSDFLNAKTGKVEKFDDAFRNQMIEAGALVDDSIDEQEELRKLILSVDDDDSFFHLIVNPTLDCNFHCWYCYESHIKNSVMSNETMAAIFSLVAHRMEIQKNMKSFHISFFGGEPLLRYREVVAPLCKSLNNLCETRGIKMTLHFTTNSFLLNEEMIRELKMYNASFQITLDGGRENHNNTRFGVEKQPTFDVIMENVRMLAEAGMHVTLRINFTRKNLDSTREISDRLCEFPLECRGNILVDYQRVWQDADPENDGEVRERVKALRRNLREYGYRCANNRLVNTVRESCYGDKTNEMLVNYNGDIFACTARDFKPENRLGKLSCKGEVKWNEEAVSLRRSSKFSKPVCRECRIAPLCGGGCRTKCMEQSHHDMCNLGHTEDSIDDLILERFEEFYMK